MRLDKFLANSGTGTRSEVRNLIKKGAVCVSGSIIKDASQEVSENDRITVFGKPTAYKKYVYIMMNKPSGVLSATEDARGEKTFADLIGEDFSHYGLSCAGRLDKDTEGFLLLTNDGDFIHRVISPKKHVNKKYYCETEREITQNDIEAFGKGMTIGGNIECEPGILERTDSLKIGGNNPYAAFVTIHEGKFHQVKRMFEARGNRVLYLKRIMIGGVFLDDRIEKGKYREMTEEEVKEIFYEQKDN